MNQQETRRNLYYFRYIYPVQTGWENGQSKRQQDCCPFIAKDRIRVFLHAESGWAAPSAPIEEHKAMPITRTQVLQIFDRIRVWQQGDKRAPHKPLLILLALGRFQRGEAPLVEFSRIDAPLKTLIDEFGPSGAGKNRHFPFWHLATDSDGGLWQLSGTSNILDRPPGATPSLTELRQNHIAAGFAPGVQSALQHDPELLQEVARRLLVAHFPETLHADILAAVGLTLLDVRHARTETAEYRPRNRDPGFRERVLRAYEYRCCVCGFDLRLGQQTIGLEAAHIKWFQAGGPDVETNGLALCSLHHKIFDLGAFTILPGSYTLVFSQQVAGGEVTKNALLERHGTQLIKPQSPDYLPVDPFLEWHANEVFKWPSRAVNTFNELQTAKETLAEDRGHQPLSMN